MKKLVVLCVLLYSCSENDDLEQISYSQFRQEVLANQIVEITYKSDQMTIIGDRFDGYEHCHRRGLGESRGLL